MNSRRSQINILNATTPDLRSATCALSHATGDRRQASVILIGYGNELRGDDAAGRRVADEVAAWELPGIKVASVHQLAPELAEALAEAELAIFVDAYLAATGAELQVSALEPDDSCTSLEHSADPRALLALTAAIYGRAPLAWFIGIPAIHLDLGAPLSSTAGEGIRAALGWIRAFSAAISAIRD